MSKKKDKKYDLGLSKEEMEELERVIQEITKEAQKVVEDYTNNPSEMSGSVVQVHENSPLLDNEKSNWTKIGDVIEEVMSDLKDKQGEKNDK